MCAKQSEMRQRTASALKAYLDDYSLKKKKRKRKKKVVGEATV